MLFDIVATNTSAEIIGFGGAGTETLNVDGKFLFDMTAADETESNTWQVVGATIDTVTYGAGFGVNYDAGSGVNAATEAPSGVWTFDGATEGFFFAFDEATGVLEAGVPPPPPAGTVFMIK